jgi:copper resistance protein B
MKTTITKIGAAVALLALGAAAAGGASAQASDPQKNGAAGQAADRGQMQMMEGMDHSQMNQATGDQSRTTKRAPQKAKAKPKKNAGAGQATGAGQSETMEGMDHSSMDHSQMNHANDSQVQSAEPASQQGKTADPQKDAAAGQASGAGHAGGMEGMDHSQMDHSQMDHSQMNHADSQQMQSPKTAPQQGHASTDSGMAGRDQGMQMGSMDGMQMGPMQGGSPPPDARNPDAYAEGASFANLPGNEMMDGMRFGRVLLDKFEYAKGDGEHGQNIDAEAWYGNDYNKAWFRTDGERRGGRLDSLRTEALWDRTFATFWSTQLGVRHDTGGGGDSRNWLAFGVRGLAPYWFDTEATAYWSGGTLGARLQARYELLFTPQLILRPEIETNLYSKSDPARGLGSGLSNLELSLRLRYEIRRQFAPYVGVTWARNFGGTADYTRARGERNKTTQLVAGVRVWF